MTKSLKVIKEGLSLEVGEILTLSEDNKFYIFFFIIKFIFI